MIYGPQPSQLHSPLLGGAGAPSPILGSTWVGWEWLFPNSSSSSDTLCTSVSGQELSHLFFLSIGMFGAVGGPPLLFKIKKPGGSFVLCRLENQSICPVLGGRRKQQSSICWKFPHLDFCFAWVEGKRNTRQKEDKKFAEGQDQQLQVMEML